MGKKLIATFFHFTIFDGGIMHLLDTSISFVIGPCSLLIFLLSKKSSFCIMIDKVLWHPFFCLYHICCKFLKDSL